MLAVIVRSPVVPVLDHVLFCLNADVEFTNRVLVFVSPLTSTSPPAVISPVVLTVVAKVSHLLEVLPKSLPLVCGITSEWILPLRVIKLDADAPNVEVPSTTIDSHRNHRHSK